MNKIIAFLVTLPVIAILLFKAVAFYEYDTKQRYIKNLIDTTAYKVKITGVLTNEEKNDLMDRLNQLAKFEENGIKLKKGSITDEDVTYTSPDYSPGETLQKGDIFSIYVVSSEPSIYSRIENGGVDLVNKENNIYYKAKSICRVEYIPPQG